MRRMWMVVFTFVPALAAAQDFTGFEIPTHRWHSISGTLSGSGSWNDRQFPGNGEEFSRLNSTAAVGGVWAFDSEDLRYSYGIRGRLDGRWEERTTLLEAPALPPIVRELRGTDVETFSELLGIEASILQYPGSGPVGWSLTGVAFGTFGQFELDNRSETEFIDLAGTARTLQVSNNETSVETYNAQALARVGMGRVRDATGVYQAWLLEERLERDGVLARPLSDDARRRIQQLFYVEPAYGVPHDLPQKFFRGFAAD